MSASQLTADRNTVVIVEAWADEVNLHPQEVQALLTALGDHAKPIPRGLHLCRADYLVLAMLSRIET